MFETSPFPDTSQFPPASFPLGAHEIHLVSSPIEHDRATFNLTSSPTSHKSQSLEPFRQEIKVPQPDNLSRLAARRRGPGRPKKGEQRPKPTSKASPRAYRREVHNDSAMRSRAKFNTALTNLWKQVPENVQLQALGEDISRQIPRAEKVEIVISYIQSLESVLNDAKDIESVDCNEKDDLLKAT